MNQTDLFGAYLNAGETLIWSGSSVGPDYSLRSILTAAAAAVCIVLVSYGWLRFFKQVKNLQQFWTKGSAAVSGSLAACMIFVFSPSTDIVYGLTNMRALSLNKKLNPPAFVGVAFSENRSSLRKNLGNTETIVFRDDSGREIVFERVRIPPEVKPHFRQGD